MAKAKKRACKTKRCKARRRKALGGFWDDMDAGMPYRIDVVTKSGTVERQWEHGPRLNVGIKAMKYCDRKDVASVSVFETATKLRGRICP